MFTQLFGHYLLSNGVVTPEQLSEALEAKSTTRVKLGALAIDAGYMSAQQVELVHAEQRRLDKRIGDIAIEMGFLTDKQVEELLKKQKTANIVLGQALIDKGFLSNVQFEKALKDYKSASGFSDSEISDEELENDIAMMMSGVREENKELLVSYISLFIRNLIRFIGDDFALVGFSQNKSFTAECSALQKLTGKYNARTAICASEFSSIMLASRYAQEDFKKCDEYVEASVGEFLNLQNGLFCVNLSNLHEIDLDMTPQEFERGKAFNPNDDGIVFSLAFSFGTVKIVFELE